MPHETHAVLNGTRKLVAPGARKIGFADPEALVEVTIKVRRKNALPLCTSCPHIQLSREEIAERHGTAQEDIDAVVRAMESFGLDAFETNCATRTVDVRGTVAQMQEAFKVVLKHYKYKLGIYRGLTGSVSVPAAVADLIVGVYGLDERQSERSRRAIAQPMSRSVLTDIPDKSERDWFTPLELAEDVFNFPAGDGSGECIAIAEFGGAYLPDDLQQFCDTVGSKMPTVETVSILDTPVDKKDGSEDESMMDVEVVAQIVPKAKIVMYFSTFTERGTIKLFDTVLQDQENNPSVLAVSWGFAELRSIWTRQMMQQIDDAIDELALAGITVCISSGDNGSNDDVDDGLAHADFPGTAKSAWCIGGLRCDKRADGSVKFSVWRDGKDKTGASVQSSGGGVSEFVLRPDYQKDITVKSVNPDAIIGRAVPDASFCASSDTGYYTVIDGTEGASGGTSAGSQFAGALIIRINAALGRRVGNITPFFYGLSSDRKTPMGKIVCMPVTTGNNVTARAGGYFANRDGNYSAACGWGAPDGKKLLAELKKVQPPKTA